MNSLTRISLQVIVALAGLALFSCYPTLTRKAGSPQEALVPAHWFYPDFRDDLDLDSLVVAVRRNLEYLRRLDPEYVFTYGNDRFTCRQVLESQTAFLELILAKPTPDALAKAIRKEFLVYRAAGRVGNNKVLFTGYFEPLYDGSLTPDETYKYPLYRKPRDLLRVNLALFHQKFAGDVITARIQGEKVVPYYTREEIDGGKVLEGRGLEIAWLKNPVDAAFLHIQGSGRLRLPDGKTLAVGYHAANGRRYRSIGKYLLDRGLLTREQMSMQSIRGYLAQNPDMIPVVLYHNPSYVFFRILDHGPLGNISVPLTPGRSVATDARLFPKGALAFLSSSKPQVNSSGKITEWSGFSRFAVIQDTGGAIKGAGRADLFWGSGPYAEVAAGNMQHEGELYLLIKKP
jgi:membrane-bound lytic murein transglycosylase A